MRKQLLSIFLLLMATVTSAVAQHDVNYGNNLPATDALGRKLPVPGETGSQKSDKLIGIFYWTWHTDGLADYSPLLNISQILNQYPEAAKDANHQAWRGITGGVFWWDEPLFGYYRTTDDWVLRKHAEMLADAGVDVVFFDCTNGSFTWKTSYTKLLEVWTQARKDGVKTPQVAFLLPFGETDGAMASLGELYDELYFPQLYKDLWFMWGGKPLIMAYPNSMKVKRNSAGLKFTATSAFYGVNAACPSWGNNIGNLTFRLYKWSNNYNQTVAGTILAEKTFVNFNDNAKLALTFDKQEAGTYLWELVNGTETVGVWKYDQTNGTSVSYFNGAQVSGNYESEIAYSSDLTFTNLTTGTSHSPVQVFVLTDLQKVNAIKSFFTFRPGQPDYVNGPSNNQQWGWLEIYPQHGFGPKTGGGYEQVTVGVAQNASKGTGGHASAFNRTDSYGRSYTFAKGQNSEKDAYFYGYNFQEQWSRAFSLNPNLVWITGWNEWTAGRWPTSDWPNPDAPFSFVDQYNAEKSRDIEPVKSWGNKGDVYYMQLISNIRKYKGMAAEEAASAEKTITMNEPASWNDVKPDFLSYKGNTIHRNHPGQGNSLTYTNITGRNDIIKSKVARDKDFIYFYVETAAALTDKSDSKWMRLFIDIDRDKKTGWEGYDFLLNRNSPADSVIVEKSESAWTWTKIGAAAYSINSTTLVLKVKRSMLGIADDKLVNFEFKWSDNMQEDGNIMDFYVNGDAAPSGRFNYHYFVDKASGLTGNRQSTFRIYPNPASQKIKVVFANGITPGSEISVLNVAGQKLWSKQLSGTSMSDEIELGFISNKGIYIVELNKKGRYSREKLIIN